MRCLVTPATGPGVSVKQIQSKLTFANLVSLLALFVALGGAAYAVGLGKNVVKSRNIAPGAVKTSDLGKKAVRTAKIGPDAVTGEKVAEATLGTVPKAADSVNSSNSANSANADLLDGIDSTAFLRGSGRYRAVAAVDSEGNGPSAPVQTDLGSLTLECRNPASVPSDFVFKNTSGVSADVWTDRVPKGLAEPSFAVSHTVVPNQGTVTMSVSGPIVVEGAALFRFQILAGQQVTLIEARIAYAEKACKFPLLISELNG